jgi:hypothetical protein
MVGKRMTKCADPNRGEAWRYRAHLVAICLCVGFAGFLGGARANADTGALTRVAQKDVLSHAVPREKFATLGKGVMHGTQWAVYAFRGASGATGAQSPCLMVAHFTSGGRYGSSTECGPLAPVLGPDAPPTYTLFSSSESNRHRREVVGETFLGMSLGTDVKSVKLEVKPGGTVFKRSRLLGEKESAAVNLRPFRYVAFAFPREFCVQHVSASDFLGNVLVSADGQECTD